MITSGSERVKESLGEHYYPFVTLCGKFMPQSYMYNNYVHVCIVVLIRFYCPAGLTFTAVHSHPWSHEKKEKTTRKAG